MRFYVGELAPEGPGLETRPGGSKLAFLCRRACSGGPRAPNTPRGLKVGVFMSGGLLQTGPGSKHTPGAQSWRFYVGGLAPEGPGRKTRSGSSKLAFLCRRACSRRPRAQNTPREFKVGVFESAGLLCRAPGYCYFSSTVVNFTNQSFEVFGSPESRNLWFLVNLLKT